MNESWLIVIGLAVATLAFRLAAPLVLAQRQIPDRVLSVTELLPPAILSALVVTLTLSDGDRLTVDARVVGAATAIVLLLMKARPVAVIGLAAAATAATRWLVP